MPASARWVREGILEKANGAMGVQESVAAIMEPANNGSKGAN
jgi:hypothetical protein